MSEVRTAVNSRNLPVHLLLNLWVQHEEGYEECERVGGRMMAGPACQIWRDNDELALTGSL